MDRTLLNLASLLIGGVGLFVVLTKVNVPHVNAAFFGDNPFAVKRDAIDAVMTWVFTAVALLGLVIQLWAEIWGGNLRTRIHESGRYLTAAAVGLATVGLLVWGLTIIGNWIARPQWLRAAVASQAEVFKRAKFVVEHDGWTPEHLANRELINADDASRFRRLNLEGAERQVAQIEELLDVPADQALNIGDRLTKLERYFSK